MLKFLLCATLFAACAGIGLIKASAFDRRQKELEKIVTALVVMESDILYTRAPVTQISQNLCRHGFCLFDNVMEIMCRCRDFEYSWNAAVSEYKPGSALDDEDFLVLKDLASELGRSGLHGQTDMTEMAIVKLRERAAAAKHLCNTKGKAYKGLGICAGLVLVLLFV